VNEPIELTSFLVELHELLIGQVFVVWALRRRDHLNALFEFVFCKVWLQALKTVKIEWIFDVLGIQLNHVVVSLQSAEPLDPALISCVLGFSGMASSATAFVRHIIHLEIFVSRVTIISLHFVLL
jgi:uncharacterized membrane protein YtjA (UPF0391 family)